MSNKSNNCPESHLKAVKFACMHQSRRSLAVAEIYHSAESLSGQVLYRAALKSEMLALGYIHFSTKHAVRFRHVCFVLRASRRQDCGRPTGRNTSSRLPTVFCHLQQSDMPLLRAQN